MPFANKYKREFKTRFPLQHTVNLVSLLFLFFLFLFFFLLLVLLVLLVLHLLSVGFLLPFSVDMHWYYPLNSYSPAIHSCLWDQAHYQYRCCRNGVLRCPLNVQWIPCVSEGILLSAGTDGHVIVWDCRSVINSFSSGDESSLCGKDALLSINIPMNYISLHQSGINDLDTICFMDRKDHEICRIFTCGDDNSIRISDVSLESLKPVRLLSVDSAHAAAITCCAAITVSYFVTSGADCRLNVWSLNVGA